MFWESVAFAVLLFVLFLAMFGAGMWAYRWKLQHRTPQEIKTTDKRCRVCLCPLPKGAIRDARGRWVCADHKGAA